MSHQRLPLTESQYPTIAKILEYLIFLVHSYPLNGQAFFKEGLMNNSSICAIISMVEFCITGSLSFKSKDREDLHSLFWVSHFYYCNPITRALLLWQSKNKTKHTKYTITHATIFSERNLETSRVTPTHRAKKKKIHIEIKMLRYTLTLYPTSSTAPHNLEGILNSQLLLEKQEL